MIPATPTRSEAVLGLPFAKKRLGRTVFRAVRRIFFILDDDVGLSCPPVILFIQNGLKRGVIFILSTGLRQYAPPTAVW